MTPEPRHRRIATHLRGILAERRIAKADAAEALDMPPTTFGRKINGNTPFSVDEVEQLVEFLGMTWEELAKATEPRSSRPTR